ncbi:MAG: hypothetical protein KA841_06655 [Chitinophagales bacterium]|nr:hypothetical protein [Chitinophagales bacterium]
MKKNFALLFVMALSVALQAQDTKKVFGSPTIIWYGVDLTKAKMIGMGDESPHKMQEEYFKPWNEVTVDMDLAKVFQKNAAYKDPNGINKMNLARETDNLKATEDVDLTAEQIAEQVKLIPVGQKKDGLAVTFIVQSFNKTTNLATVHVAFFDVASRSVLWLKKMTGKASGGSPAKAWAGAIKDIFNQIEKKEFSAWKKEANY